MRKSMVNALVLRGLPAAVLLAIVAYGPALGQTQPASPAAEKPAAKDAKEAAPKPDAAKPAAGSLEDLLAKALKDNPDVRVAETKVREAEAELNRIRLLVVQKVAAHNRAIESQKAAVGAAEAELQRSGELYKKGFAADVDEAKAKLAQAKAKLAEIEAELPYLLGKQPEGTPWVVELGGFKDVSGQVWANQPFKYTTTLDPQFFTVNTIERQHVPFVFSTAVAAPAVTGSMAERIRKALDTPVTANYKDKVLDDILKDIQQKAPGVPFLPHVPRDFKDLKLSLQLSEQVPLGAMIQALEDVSGLQFGVREYGVLVVGSGNQGATSLPTGAMRLHDFWKQQTGTDKPKPSESKK